MFIISKDFFRLVKNNKLFFISIFEYYKNHKGVYIDIGWINPLLCKYL